MAGQRVAQERLIVQGSKSPVTFFATAAAFRAWLAKNHASATELLVGYHKVHTGQPSMTWPESVDEALCFGWIDGVRKRIDEHTYQIRFTPRKKTSIWSAVNIAKVEALIRQKRMRPAGLAAYSHRRDDRSGVYSFERKSPAAFSAAQLRQFKRDKAAWRFFQSTPPGYQRMVTHWVLVAKQEATRERRFAQLVQGCAEGRRLLQW